MERFVTTGDVIRYADRYGRLHNALVTCVHDGSSGDVGSEEAQRRPGMENPCLNLLYVGSDVSKKDQYGRQIERETSVVYKESQTAHGFFWCYPGES